jgi:glycosyltransferase involved in cell wall biosynthesis
MRPIFTIVTVVLNDKEGILKTLNSVSEQNYPSLEHIIIDGESKDGTLTVLESFKKHSIKIISEKDNGIYDAMNKGIGLSKGQYIAFLNAADIYLDGVLQSIEKLALKDPSIDIFYSNALLEEKGKPPRLYRSDRNVKLSSFYRMPIAHSTMFCKLDLINRIGPFDTRYKIAADYKIALDCCLAGAKMQYQNTVWVKMSGGGISDRRLILGYNEMKSILHNKHLYNYYMRARTNLSETKAVLCTALSKTPLANKLFYQFRHLVKSFLVTNEII